MVRFTASTLVSMARGRTDLILEIKEMRNNVQDGRALRTKSAAKPEKPVHKKQTPYVTGPSAAISATTGAPP